MDWFSNEVLFYGGIGIILCALAGAAAAFFIFKIKAQRLEIQLDKEYGPVMKRSGEM